jgi:hypothetical protein
LEVEDQVAGEDLAEEVLEVLEQLDQFQLVLPYAKELLIQLPLEQVGQLMDQEVVVDLEALVTAIMVSIQFLLQLRQQAEEQVLIMEHLIHQLNKQQLMVVQVVAVAFMRPFQLLLEEQEILPQLPVHKDMLAEQQHLIQVQTQVLEDLEEEVVVDKRLVQMQQLLVEKVV